MYKKYLIIASKKDKAGINITTALSQFGKFDFYLREEEIISDQNLDLEKISKYDFIIFASKHSSEKGGKTLSVHPVGNWRTAELGGKSNQVCKSSALFQKQMFEKLHEVAEEHSLKDYQITMECTHHGPHLEKPCVFIEIGSTPTEWNDRRAAFVIAKTISETIANFKENPYNEVAIAIGGPHYCQSFNRLQLDSNVAISHVIPKYVVPITKEMIEQAISQTQEEVDFAVLDWKGIGNSEHRNEVIQILEELYIQWKKTGDIPK